MLFIMGLILLFGSVLGAYSVHGDLRVLWQPLEFAIIFGAATAAYLISNPGDVIKTAFSYFKYLFKGKPYQKKHYMELLLFMFETFKLMKTKGMLQLESHIENPHESEIFKKYPLLEKDHHVLPFICDTLRLLTIGIENHYVMSDVLDEEIEAHHHGSEAAASSLTTFGESLPALGIVAAVLGVILTMGSISQPPEILGHLIGAALVGTFAGVLFSYGIFSPIGAFVKHIVDSESAFLKCIKVGIISNMQGNAPTITVEIVRKAIPNYAKPNFAEVDIAINGSTEGK